MAKDSFSPLDSCSIRPGQAWLQIETKYQGKVLQQSEIEQLKINYNGIDTVEWKTSYK